MKNHEENKFNLINQKPYLISIIVPIYNTAKYLDECILSIINQTYKNLEIILVNDGSTDNSLDICRKYEKSDDRIIVIDNENGGVVIARRCGFKISKGEYITFIDSDDFIEPDMLSYMENIMTNQNCDLVQIQFKYPHMDKEFIKSQVVEENIYERDEFENLVFPKVHWGKSLLSPYLCSKMLKRKDLQKAIDLVPSKIKAGEDSVCVAIATEFLNRICISNNLLYYYRTDREEENSACDTYSYKELFGSYEMFRFYRKYYKEINSIILEQCQSRYKGAINNSRKYNKTMNSLTSFDKILKTSIFPIWEISNIKNIMIYGANEVGISNYMQIQKLRNIENIGNIENLKLIDETKAGILLNCVDENIKIKSPSILNETSYDLIIISGYEAEFAEIIKNRLISLYNVDNNKIMTMLEQAHSEFILFEEVI